MHEYLLTASRIKLRLTDRPDIIFIVLTGPLTPNKSTNLTPTLMLSLSSYSNITVTNNACFVIDDVKNKIHTMRGWDIFYQRLIVRETGLNKVTS